MATTPSVLVIDKSAVAVNVSVSVALLLPGLVSITPAGGSTVPVLTRWPVALALMLATTVSVMVLPDGMLTVSLMFPAPAAVNPEAPPLPAAVKLALAIAAGMTSLIAAPTTSLGPLLATTIV